MAPPFGFPNFDFLDEDSSEQNDVEVKEEKTFFGFSEMAFWYTVILVAMLLLWLLIFFCLRMISLRQKARNNQQRRPYIGSRSRNSLPQADPTIYVSPANLTPPPKYEAMAPPSYEEVVGIHYPSFTPTQIQPIAQPIATAMAQNASASSTADVPENRNPGDQTINPPTVITVTNERTVVTASS
ncbi:uncharacterized protein [Battus philenor]|uniref:uncharacterized protein isoform X1 n=1 Tax=Battus philenor TaxID=42288 RepID=UPI0035D0F1B8